MTSDARTPNAGEPLAPILAPITAASTKAMELVVGHLSRPSVPKILYHYTDLAGASGIVTGGKLWATNADYMNDATELLLGARVFREAATNLGLPSDLVSDTLNQIREQTYITCFSERGDLLSQWRAYCPDGGVALGFSPLDDDSAFRRVSYDPDLLHDLTQAICEPFARVWSDVGVSTNEQHRDYFGVTLAAAVLPLCVQFKDRAFEEEIEWRRSSFPSEPADIKVRPRSSLLIPYLEIPYAGDLGLTEVILSPGLDERNEFSLRLMLEGTDVNVVRSSIPCRT